jgi:hypothetical protein
VTGLGRPRSAGGPGSDAAGPRAGRQAGVFPMSRRKIAAYLRVNFSPGFLAQRVGGQPRRDALIAGTWRARAACRVPEAALLGGNGRSAGPGCAACLARGCSCEQGCHGSQEYKLACLQPPTYQNRHCRTANGAARAQFPSAVAPVRYADERGPHMRQGCRQGGRVRVRGLSAGRARAREALRLGLTEKFLAEDQPPAGQHGHMRAALAHRRASPYRSNLPTEPPARPRVRRCHVWQAHAAAARDWRAGPAWGT